MQFEWAPFQSGRAVSVGICYSKSQERFVLLIRQVIKLEMFPINDWIVGNTRGQYVTHPPREPSLGFVYGQRPYIRETMHSALNL